MVIFYSKLLFQSQKHLLLYACNSITKGAVVLMFLLMQHRSSAQLSLSPDAYKLFTDKSPSLKLKYLRRIGSMAFPLVAEKLTDNQNPDYAKLGIRSVVVVRELNGVKDTLAIRKYNSDGFMTERDTFNLMYADKGSKYLSKTYYDYFLKDKTVKERSLDIVFERDTSYVWQASLKMIFYYDIKNRLIRRKGWHSGNDTSNLYFESDSNDVVIAEKGDRSANGIANGEQFDYKLDEKGRLTNITRYYKHNRQFPGVKGNTKDVPSPGYEVDSSITLLVYNDKERSIKVLFDKTCHANCYLNKERQAFENYCYYELHGKFDQGQINSENIIFDRQLRIKETSKKYLGLNSTSRYHYNRQGLLNTIVVNSTVRFPDPGGTPNKIISNTETQKIFFYYFKDEAEKR